MPFLLGLKSLHSSNNPNLHSELFEFLLKLSDTDIIRPLSSFGNSNLLERPGRHWTEDVCLNKLVIFGCRSLTHEQIGIFIGSGACVDACVQLCSAQLS